MQLRVLVCFPTGFGAPVLITLLSPLQEMISLEQFRAAMQRDIDANPWYLDPWWKKYDPEHLAEYGADEEDELHPADVINLYLCIHGKRRGCALDLNSVQCYPETLKILRDHNVKIDDTDEGIRMLVYHQEKMPKDVLTGIRTLITEGKNPFNSVTPVMADFLGYPRGTWTDSPENFFVLLNIIFERGLEASLMGASYSSRSEAEDAALDFKRQARDFFTLLEGQTYNGVRIVGVEIEIAKRDNVVITSLRAERIPEANLWGKLIFEFGCFFSDLACKIFGFNTRDN